MRTVLLNGKRMNTKKSTHLYLKRKLSFPAYYGKNLDALWDVLSTMSDETDIVLYNKENLDENLGIYGNTLLSVFNEAAESNKRIKFRVVDIKVRN